jgi:TorA maturation chaperone TorD
VVTTGPEVAARDAPLGLADVAAFRSATYRLASGAVRYPTPAGLHALASDAASMLDAGDGLRCFASYEDWRSLLRGARRIAKRPLESLRATYVSLFVAPVPRLRCPLLASAYVEDAGGAPWLLVELERAYARAGVQPSGAAEPADHLATELEFLALLCERESRAWEGGSPAGAAILEGWQREFLGHMRAWLPALASRLSEESPGSPYQALVEALMAYVGYDHDLVAALLGMARPGSRGAA